MCMKFELKCWLAHKPSQLYHLITQPSGENINVTKLIPSMRHQMMSSRSNRSKWQSLPFNDEGAMLFIVWRNIPRTRGTCILRHTTLRRRHVTLTWLLRPQGLVAKCWAILSNSSIATWLHVQLIFYKQAGQSEFEQ